MSIGSVHVPTLVAAVLVVVGAIVVFKFVAKKVM